jgi:hypothetical protein
LKPWVTPEQPVETPWVSVPGLLTAECKSNAIATYLEITVHGDPSDPRIDDIVGDLTPDWGLHLVDFNVGMGNLVEIVGGSNLEPGLPRANKKRKFKIARFLQLKIESRDRRSNVHSSISTLDFELQESRYLKFLSRSLYFFTYRFKARGPTSAP